MPGAAGKEGKGVSKLWFDDEYRERERKAHTEAWGHHHELSPCAPKATAQNDENGHWCLRCGFPKVPETTALATDAHREWRHDDGYLCHDCFLAIGRAAGWLPTLEALLEAIRERDALKLGIHNVVTEMRDRAEPTPFRTLGECVVIDAFASDLEELVKANE